MAAGYTIETASKRVSDQEGQTTWLVAVRVNGDTSNVKSVHYAFPAEVAQGLVEGGATQPGFPVGGKVLLASDITGFKLRARVTMKDDRTAVADGQLKLGEEQAPSPAPKPQADEPDDSSSAGDILDDWE